MPYRSLICSTILALFYGILTNTHAADTPISCSAASGDKTVALLELYTSEGCSSCPPADTWLAKLSTRKLPADRIVPLALHVDYWDNLGWKDPFSQKRFTERQRYYARLHRSHAVYTPQFLMNGKIYNGWYRKNIDQDIAEINRTKPGANIRLRLEYRNPHTVHITGKTETPDYRQRPHSNAFLAIYENNLVNKIDAGENDGLTLKHNFVIRRLHGPISVDNNGVVHFKHSFIIKHDWKKNDLGIAAFVQNRVTGEILQAMAMPLCR